MNLHSSLTATGKRLLFNAIMMLVNGTPKIDIAFVIIKDGDNRKNVLSKGIFHPYNTRIYTIKLIS